jgi:ATP-dependent DNA ligase
METLLININKTNSTLEKQKELAKYKNDEEIKKLFFYTYNPMIQFNVSSKNVEKFSKNKGYQKQEYKKIDCLFELLDKLRFREITGNSALKTVNEFIINNNRNREIVNLVLDKNLKIRLNQKNINKVFTGLLPDFKPVLAYVLDSKINFDENWYISRKLDGVRCLIEVNDGQKKTFSRTGKELYNLETILDSIKIKGHVFLDGEVCYIEDGKENFKKTIEVVRKSKTKVHCDKLFYKLFDVIDASDFLSAKGTINFNQRIKLFENFKYNKSVVPLKQWKYSDKTFEKLKDTMKIEGWEGLMVRKNTGYCGGRTRDLIKVKSFLEEEFTVQDTINGEIRIIENNSEKTIRCLSAVVINFKGKSVKVGSGFSIDERKHFFDKRNIIGKVISVQYFEITTDGSLRFPTFKSIRDYE